MKKHPTACKNRPKQCKCDPRIWEGWWRVCDKFIKDPKHADGRCKTCEHEKACHVAERRTERRRERRKTVNMPKTSKPLKPAVRSSKLVDALETARTLVHKRRLEAREAGHRCEAQDWCDTETMLTKAIAIERGRAPTAESSDSAGGRK